jgi:3'(2'), 5'-bisphosphate nucleotidase
MRDEWLLSLLKPVCVIAADASKKILIEFDILNKDKYKEDILLTTVADSAANQIIITGLGKLTPDIPIVSEESAVIPFTERSQWQLFWLIDPIDGTKEFMQRNYQFTVNIALIENHKPVLGVVRVPISGLCYFAVRGYGSFRKALNRVPIPIQVGTCRSPVRVVISRSHFGSGILRLQEFLSKLSEYDLSTVGSSLKLCQVAEGSADVYPRFGPTSEWDTAAAQAIVEMAGGKVVSVETGEPLSYNTTESLLNPHFIVYGDENYKYLSYINRQ